MLMKYNRKVDFPIFASSPHVYLDSAATTHKPEVVIRAMADFYRNHYGTVRRGLYQLSAQATRIYEETREQIARFLNAKESAEVVFTSGATEGINLVAESFLKHRLQENDEIVISILEHHANFIPWQQLARENKARLIILPLDQHGEIDLTALKNVLSPKTKLLAIGHVSNVTGGINPVRQMIELAHTAGVPVLIDGAQSIAHLKIDVQDLDCDFFAFSGHKVYGPTGIGVLFGKKKWLEEMPPYRYGGEMILEVTADYSRFKNPPHRFEAGTPNIAGVIGLKAALAYVSSLDLAQIHTYEKQITDHLTQELRRSGVRIIGAPMERSSVVSFLVDDIHPHDVATILDSQNIAVRAGHHCAQPLMRYLNIPATVRASVGWYNDLEDVEQLIKGIIYTRKVMQ
ncbi:MAG: cysteine desulfurase [Saprospiraceae bacterium]|nr:cysteine desulfurase [Saprospiraceae bacterium]